MIIGRRRKPVLQKLLLREINDVMDEESLERIMRFQANKIGMLERDVRAMTTRFGRKERALMSEVTALHRRLRVQSDELAANLALFDAVNRKAGADKDGITATSKDGHCQTASAVHPVETAVFESTDGSTTAKAKVVPLLFARRTARNPPTAVAMDWLPPWRPLTRQHIGTQTDPISSEDEDDDVDERDEAQGLLSRQTELLLFDDDKAAAMNELELAVDGFIDDTDLEERCRQQLNNVEYEEVSLRRSTSCDRLGLTLCYGAIDEEDTDIFISEVERNSVADRDGRVRPGDQILQINNADVHTRNEAIELFRRSGAEITLLLARAVDDATLLTDVPSSKCLSPMPEQQPEDDDQGALTDANSNNSAHEKDSGISRTTDSEPELLPPPIKSPDVEVSPTAARCALAVMESGGGGSSSATQTPTTDVATTCKTTPTTPHADGLSSALSSPGSEAPPFPAAARRMARSDSDGSLERELASLHREMETIRIECDRLISKHATAERRVAEQVVQAQSLMLTMDRLAKQQVQSPPHGQSSQQPQPRAGYSNQPEYLQQQQQLPLETNVRLRRDNNYKRPPVEDTSSAYNTGGESCRSTPMKADYAHVELRRTAASNSSPFRLPQYSVALPNQPSVPLHHPYQSSRPLAVHEPVTSPTTTLQPGDTLYTSPAHLAQTITLQQRLLRQAMIQQAQLLKQHGGEALLNGPVQSNSLHQALGASEELNCEWKVKRRSDGSRYITKRPVRNRLLREREEQLKNERVGVSTDDDAMSELKIGRFWTREERKKHLEKARERKLRQQELLRRKAASLGQPSDQMIVQLSQKKMMRRKGQQLFDKFTTIQEFLAHGNRVGGGSQAFGGILSVTTV